MEIKQIFQIAKHLFIGVLMVVFLINMSFTSPKQDVKTWVYNDVTQVANTIKSWSKYGYSVQSITAQSASIATGRGADFTIKGDIILVMVK